MINHSPSKYYKILRLLAFKGENLGFFGFDKLLNKNNGRVKIEERLGFFSPLWLKLEDVGHLYLIKELTILLCNTPKLEGLVDNLSTDGILVEFW